MRAAPTAAGQDPTSRPVRLGDLRAAVDPACRRRSTARAVRDLGRDLALYAAAIAGVLLSGSPPVQIAFGIVAGVVAAAMFVWAHDAAHGTLFDSKRTNEVLGTALMLPSLQMYRLWQFGHNRVHHGFTGLTIIDWIWRPWSPAEYREASPLARLGYRIERSMLGCGWHYLRRVWWDGMVRFRGTTDRQRRDARLGRSLVATWVVVAAAGAWAVGGWWAVLAAVVVPWLVFTQVIAATIYLHHTHPSRRFVDDRSQWDPVTGQVTGSVVIHASRPAAWFFHYILVHTPHHLDSRIPYYRLTEAWRELKPAVADLDVLEYRLSLRTARACFRECKLFDYGSGRWARFGAPEASPAPAPAAAA
jgi:omega-6 fatty acid desaturase (delta-12 desaturase)